MQKNRWCPENRWRRVLGLLLICAMPACGGSTDPAAEPATGTADTAPEATLDPCALVTREEAEMALGGAVNDAERPAEANIPPRLATCRYVAEMGQRLAVLTVMVRYGDSETESRVGFEQAKELFPSAEAVPGLGEDAFRVDNQLHVRRGLVYLNITGDIDAAQARALADTALARL